MPKSILGIITIDINGAQEPNQIYLDQFHLPVGRNGIDYEQFCELANTSNTDTILPGCEDGTIYYGTENIISACNRCGYTYFKGLLSCCKDSTQAVCLIHSHSGGEIRPIFLAI